MIFNSLVLVSFLPRNFARLPVFVILMTGHYKARRRRAMTAGGMMCRTTLKVSPVGSKVNMGVRDTRTHKPIFPYEIGDQAIRKVIVSRNSQLFCELKICSF
jgi:hypothetical protein